MTEHPVLGELPLASVEDIDPYHVVDLVAQGEQLLHKARTGGTGRAVRSVSRQPGLNVILLALPTGGSLPEHDAPGPASLLCLSGEVVLSTARSSWTLPAGTLHAIPPERHDVRADTDSVCVLTVALPR